MVNETKIYKERGRITYMESAASILINALIDKCENENMKKGFKAALSIIENSGYVNIFDLEEMDEDSIYQEALDLNNLNESEME